ncbi:MAG TPA: hypothetical protein PK466_14060 [Thermotogota bacterium]|nr:hypothetical protein [Thermotogota bacterium]
MSEISPEKQKLYAEIDKLDKKEEIQVAKSSLTAINKTWNNY